MFTLSCGPKPIEKPVPPFHKVEIPPPFALKAEAGNRQAIISWSINRPEEMLLSGYNIYLSDGLIADSTVWKLSPGQPYNSQPYPGDTDGDTQHESMPLTNLVNGRIYYIFVRTVGSDGGESVSSNVTLFRPLAQGEFTISINHETPDGGFNFENEKSVPGRDPRSDIYLYATENKTGLSSPSRLGAGLRQTDFHYAGSKPDAPGAETVPIKVRDTFELTLKSGQARINILEISGRYPDVSARIGYIYYPNLSNGR
jgi:hypothetical protein